VTKPLTVEVVELDEPIDLDAWVEMYVDALLELEGLAPGGPEIAADGTMGAETPVPVTRSR